jgi:hypothetical protein
MSAKYFVCFLEITNSTSRIAVIVWNPVSKSTFCLNLTNTAFVGRDQVFSLLQGEKLGPIKRWYACVLMWRMHIKLALFAALSSPETNKWLRSQLSSLLITGIEKSAGLDVLNPNLLAWDATRSLSIHNLEVSNDAASKSSP